MLTGNGRTITYTSFGMVKSVTENGETVTYSYGPVSIFLPRISWSP